ncbi:transferase hexapeptide (six repeat-containing protein) [Roseomonas rosea]|uniref:Transferase hexapeptide (Six repeat-containing protein) n=1 Tax=Muricoccus roseus TaxID=198092 RepID=A0A1M6AHF1_9PROT|nr:CatB-related O-acetyltransferase [Roseomonas rosea]SHI35944.1 transferase hexapeptide (six repeat-containing protein) [Roseomonas rosea]
MTSVLRNDKRGLTLRLDAEARRWLQERRIFMGRAARPFRGVKQVFIPARAKIEPYACYPDGERLFDMGAFSYSNTGFTESVRIGRYCSIARGVKILRQRHPIEWATTSSITYDCDPRRGYASFVAAHQDFNAGRFEGEKPPGLMGPGPTIEHDVWIGEDARLARGIRIGTGSVIAAGAIVTRDVPPYSIVGGVPARLIRWRFPEEVTARLLASRWWEYGPDIFQEANYRDPAAFADAVSAMDPSRRLKLKPLTVQEVIEHFGPPVEDGAQSPAPEEDDLD